MKITPELLEKYYLGQCTPGEIKAVEQWQIRDDPEKLLFLSQTDKDALENEIWQELQKNTIAELVTHEQFSPISLRRERKSSHMVWQVAASLLLVSAITTIFIRKQFAREKPEPIVYKTVSTGRGQKASVTLTDGTTVVLNSQSSLRYPAHFTDTSRVLYLKGEGYFTVARDPSRPFSIYTSRTLTRVLGTVFDLKAYDHEVTTLVVEEGRVRFGNLKNLPQTIYTAGKWSQFDLSGASDVKTINAVDYTAWKENKLVFTGQTLAQIIPVLQRWYNVDIKINNAALSAQRFTGEFDNRPVSFLLDRMSFVMKFHYSLNQQTIIIK